MNKRLLMLVAALLAIPPALADQGCSPAPRDIALRGFEKKLAQTYPAVRARKTRSALCSEDIKSGYADCEFIDKGGVLYLVEGNEVIRVEVVAPNAQLLPFGIRLGESTDSVKRKLSAVLVAGNSVKEVRNEDDNFVLAPPRCLSSGGQQYDIYWVFDNKRKLIRFGLREPW